MTGPYRHIVVALAASAGIGLWALAARADRDIVTGSIVPVTADPAAAAAPRSPEILAPGPAEIVADEDRAAVDPGLVRDAVLAYRKADLVAGDRIRARITDPAAGTLLDWAAIRWGGSAIHFERAAAFLRDHPDWPAAASVRRRAEEELVAERKPADIVRAFFVRERPQTVGGKLALALAFKTDGLPADAAALIRETWRNDTFGREIEARIVEQFADALGPADHRFRMERFLFRENWDAAKRAADYAGRGYDTLVKARSAIIGKAPNAAKLLDGVPPALRQDTSYLYSRAEFLRRAERQEEAAKAIAEASRDPAILVDGDEWWVERRLIARKLLDSGDPKAAYAVVSQNGAAANEKRIEAEFHAGWIALRFLSEPATAAGHFARAAAIAQSPISVARAAYWQGRASEAAGAADVAAVHFARAADRATTYYGQLAAEKLGRSVASVRPALDRASPERRMAVRSEIARAVALLYGADLREVAMPLAVDLARRSDKVAEMEAVGDLALANGDARTLLALGKAATQRGLPLDERAFPTIGVPAFEAAGPAVERAMVFAIARQESAFDPAAGSPVGARGLMQLMPATAAATARKFGIEYDPARLLDAPYNARLGSAHLGELMESWSRSHILTFASYNAGPGNVRKWIDAYGDPRKPGIDPIDWVERIPFSETRNYVQRVMENLLVYRTRLEEKSAFLSREDIARAAGR